jgi:23S rRNA (guanine745-N1)-methyltransferase
MVQARASFLAARRYGPIAAALAATACTAAEPPRSAVVVDVGAGTGTGYYLTALLRNLEGGASGIPLDASAPSLRRTVCAHPRIAAVGCDICAAARAQPGGKPDRQRVRAARRAGDRTHPRSRRSARRGHPARHLHELLSALELLEVGADQQDRLRRSLASSLACGQPPAGF